MSMILPYPPCAISGAASFASENEATRSTSSMRRSSAVSANSIWNALFMVVASALLACCC